MLKRRISLLLALMLVPVSFAFAAPESCTRDTTWTTGEGAPLVCYHCSSATYCYPA